MILHRLTYVLIVLALVACAAPPYAPTPQAEALPMRPSVSAATSQPSLPTPSPTLSATPEASLPVPTPVPAALFDDQRLTYEPGFYALQIQAFLDDQPGTLKGIVMPVGDRQHTFAEALTGQAIYYGVNPKIILALIELQSGLIGDPQPTADQFAWALGFSRRERTATRIAGAGPLGCQGNALCAARLPAAPCTDLRRRQHSAAAGRHVACRIRPGAGACTNHCATTPSRTDGAVPRNVHAPVRRPARPLTDRSPPSPPFLTRPIGKVVPTTSFFDHGVRF